MPTPNQRLFSFLLLLSLSHFITNALFVAQITYHMPRTLQQRTTTTTYRNEARETKRDVGSDGNHRGVELIRQLVRRRRQYFEHRTPRIVVHRAINDYVEASHIRNIIVSKENSNGGPTEHTYG